MLPGDLIFFRKWRVRVDLNLSNMLVRQGRLSIIWFQLFFIGGLSVRDFLKSECTDRYTLNGGAIVSVVMPAYNAQETIGEAIISILNQTMSSLELSVVDDASTDATSGIVTAMMKGDPRLSIYRNERNSRLGPIEWEPRNDGLKYATGQFIAYLDADNTWETNFLAEMTGVIQSDASCMLAYCRTKNYYDPVEKAAVVRNDRRPLLAEGECWTIFDTPAMGAVHWGIDGYVDTNEMVHRASIFEKLGYLWRTVHPDREKISRAQSFIRPCRRHNDLDLFERVLAVFGASAIKQHPGVLVNFYYPSYRAYRTRINEHECWR
jgi:glycosyltransferase involved in cell wall biosynthesis